MKIKFTKMQGLGNDFVVLDAVRQDFVPTPAQVRFLADRHFGVGCDQLLVVERPTQPGVDFRYRIFNADGGEVEQCGNGARCFARYVVDSGLADKREIRVETCSGIIAPRIEDNGEVSVDMGVPRFLPAEIPFVADAGAVTHAQQGRLVTRRTFHCETEYEFCFANASSLITPSTRWLTLAHRGGDPGAWEAHPEDSQFTWRLK